MLMSRELNAALDVLTLSNAWEDMVGADPDAPALAEITDLLGAATVQFGICELYAKKADRGEALSQGKSRSRHYMTLALAHHERGLGILRKAIEAGDDFSSQADDIRLAPRKEAAEQISAFRDEFFEYVSEGELRVSDMEKLRALFDQTAEQMLSSKRPGDQIAVLLKQAHEARASEDRGLRDNLPRWKIAIIAAYLAVSVWKIWRCTVRNRCSRRTKAALQAAAAVLGVSLKFC